MSKELENDQEGERTNPTPFRKGELHVESSSEIIIDPVEGFVKAPVVTSMAVGDEEMVLGSSKTFRFFGGSIGRI